MNGCRFEEGVTHDSIDRSSRAASPSKKKQKKEKTTAKDASGSDGVGDWNERYQQMVAEFKATQKVCAIFSHSPSFLFFSQPFISYLQFQNNSTFTRTQFRIDDPVVMGLIRLNQDFLVNAEMYGRIIIMERHLPSKKSKALFIHHLMKLLRA